MMCSNQVYRSLLELFPQIDCRILRAVSIEHSKDADLAAMAVVTEVIPFCAEKSKLSKLLAGEISVGEPSEVLNSGNTQSLHDDDGGNNEQPNTSDANFERITNAAKLLVSEEVKESSISSSADVCSHGEHVPLIDESGLNVCPTELSEEPVMIDKIGLNVCQTELSEEPAMIDEIGLNVSQTKSSEEPVIEETESTYKCPEITIETSSRKSLLEDILAVAGDDKKILLCHMEAIVSLMKEVEIKEQAAQQAKEEAAMWGINILDKVEELKKMLPHAKEANDIQAGEVYGEKAILATEVREFQSRVLSMSDERDKSLAVLNEMQQKLQVRLAAAEDVIKSAEQEKQLKESAAYKALAEQEMIMEEVVQKSKILKQQSEDNGKLQEFLMDRGQVVDMLQGEIAVICQDVMLLKEKFDRQVPFSKLVSSNQTSCILASSSSSMKSLIPNQGEPVQTDPEIVTEDKLALGNIPLLDDGWEIFYQKDINA